MLLSIEKKQVVGNFGGFDAKENYTEHQESKILIFCWPVAFSVQHCHQSEEQGSVHMQLCAYY